jgi:hypothetical protein
MGEPAFDLFASRLETDAEREAREYQEQGERAREQVVRAMERMLIIFDEVDRQAFLDLMFGDVAAYGKSFYGLVPRLEPVEVEPVYEHRFPKPKPHWQQLNGGKKHWMR